MGGCRPQTIFFLEPIPKLIVLFHQSKAGTMKVEPMQYTGETLKDASDDRPIIHPCITLAFLDKADYRISLSIYMYLCTIPFYLFSPIFSNNLKREFVHTSKYHLTRNFQSNPQFKINSERHTLW